MSDPMLLIGCLLVPLIGAVLISRADSKPNLREGITLVTASVLFTLVLSVYFRMQNGQLASVLLAEPFSGLRIVLKVEPLGLIFALVASSLWLVTSIYAIGYMRAHHEQNQTRFFTLFAVAISAVMGVAFADNLFTLFLFYEILTLSTYPLVTHSGTDKARKSGRIYLGILMGSSIGLFLFGIAAVWSFADTLTFQTGGILQGKMPPSLVMPLYMLFLLGIGKAAVMPMHRWLPAAMVAPTPVSALLHAVAVVKAGVFSLLKITLMIFGPDFLSQSGATAWLIWLPLLTILLASLTAMTRDNIKERLAYSTISQLSYIVLAALLANQLGLFAGGIHIVMHALAKIVLFFAAGAILVTTHKTQVSELNGLGRQMPLTFMVFTLASLSIVGLPPFGGMWSKWFLVQGTLSMQGPDAMAWVVLGVLLISALLNIVYLLAIPVRAFFAKPPQQDIPLKEAPLPCLIGLVVPSAISVLLFFYPQPLFSLAAAATGGQP